MFPRATCVLVLISRFGWTLTFLAINLYHSLGWFSRWQIGDIFLIFPWKKDSTFFIGDNLLEMSNPVFGKNKKKKFKMSSAENFTQSAKPEQPSLQFITHALADYILFNKNIGTFLSSYLLVLRFEKSLFLACVLLNLDIPCICKQCRRSQLIWIYTVCH